MSGQCQSERHIVTLISIYDAILGGEHQLCFSGGERFGIGSDIGHGLARRIRRHRQLEVVFLRLHRQLEVSFESVARPWWSLSYSGRQALDVGSNDLTVLTVLTVLRVFY